jgi:hypothetical protein
VSSKVQKFKKKKGGKVDRNAYPAASLKVIFASFLIPVIHADLFPSRHAVKRGVWNPFLAVGACVFPGTQARERRPS